MMMIMGGNQDAVVALVEEQINVVVVPTAISVGLTVLIAKQKEHTQVSLLRLRRLESTRGSLACLRVFPPPILEEKRSVLAGRFRWWRGVSACGFPPIIIGTQWDFSNI
jgi:hypothetical protein